VDGGRRCGSCGWQPKEGQPARINAQFHAGNNRFPCGGRFFASKSVWVRNVNWAVMLSVLGLFFGFDAPYLWRELSPALPLVVAVLAVLTSYALLRVSLMDPGVIPRGLEEEYKVPGKDRAA
jgi:palmitoyltransferase ZDHHC9/14/18